MQRLLFVCFLIFLTNTLFARVMLPRIFSEHMVIQRNKPVHIWGWADPGERVTVTMAFASRSVRTSRTGKWEVSLPPMPSGGPYTLIVAGNNTIRFEDVMSGEVWLCSGQSNMEWPLRAAANAKEEIRMADYPMIRHFKVPNTVSFNLKEDIGGGSWEICSPATASDFTAVGYFFALELLKELKVPIGLINASWGGTNVESWISGDAFFANETFSSLKNKMPENGDSIAIRKSTAVNDRIKRLQGKFPTVEEEQLFSKKDFNDASWRTMKVPGHWESSDLPDIDGTVWFRKAFFIPDDANIGDGVLTLGKVDDMDSTFVNGIFLGATNGWDLQRMYTFKKDVLLHGRNVVSVKVTDYGFGGGIYGPEKIFMAVGDRQYDLSGEWKYIVANAFKSQTVGPNEYPTVLYNGMIHPLTPFPIAGVIWYQGESNTGRAHEYRTSFPLMITNWRNKWKEDFPFYFVQLANFQASGGTSQNGGSTWAELREAQTNTLTLPKTGMAVTIDIGDSKDIHPANKQDVGKRLAANALAKTYSRPRVHQGPMFASMRIDGARIFLNFNNTESGWDVRDKYGYINGFEIAGADHQFRYARAYLSGNSIVVEHDSVPAPVAVRYGWADDPDDLNLYNKEGFPAVPFRTDKWKQRTESAKYAF